MYIFREANERDIDGIAKLITSKEELFYVHPKGRYPFTVDQVRELFRTRKELTVAVNGNEIIGFANLYDYVPEKSAFIGNVVIDKRFRGKGVGKDIVSRMLKLCYNKHNLKEVRISVFTDNTPALLLYNSLGFIPYELEERENPQGNRVALLHLKLH
jgi:ribosomal protein S18 acetylase RimI-like enzyme